MKWEYYTLKFPTSFWLDDVDDGALTTELNKLGNEGWELSGTFHTSASEGRTHQVFFVLKRALQN